MGCTVFQRFSIVSIVILAAGLGACNNSSNTAQSPPAQTPAADASNVSTGDPANGNLAPADRLLPAAGVCERIPRSANSARFASSVSPKRTNHREWDRSLLTEPSRV